jgi:hypothetical protein
MMAEEFVLAQYQYATPVKGEVMRLYTFGEDGYHSGGQWFTSGPLQYPEEQIDALEAAIREMTARMHGLETRVTNGDDQLLFHSKGGKILYPPDITGSQFWGSV